MYKVFIYDKVIFFTDDVNSTSDAKNDKFIKFEGLEKLLKTFEEFVSNKEYENLYVFIEKNANKIFDEFISSYKLIEAAGGIVKNNKNEYLFIFRFGRWDLPKGHIEKGENPETTAKRELEEETSISDLNIIKQLPCTFHSYILNNKRVIKKTYWFEMITKSEQTPKPQIEESITKAEWVTYDKIKFKLRNSYLSIKELLNQNFNF